MEFHSVQLTSGKLVSGEDCRIEAQAAMVEVLQRTANSGRPFMFVQDNEGAPIGLIAADEILEKVANCGPSDVHRWMEMPVESALQSRLDVPHGTAESVSGHCVHVSYRGKTVGVITNDDVLVSWKSIQKTIQNSQGDAMTGLPNRAFFDKHLKAEINRCTRIGHSIAVILIDLDYFKQINDRFGHAAGDTALRTIATTIRESLRSYDLVARFGGDEFAVVCSGCRPGEIDIVVRRIRDVVLNLQNDPEVPRPIPTVTIGATVIHDLPVYSSPSCIVGLADQCLYAAKNSGRNCGWKSEVSGERTAVPTPVRNTRRHDSLHTGSSVEVTS